MKIISKKPLILALVTLATLLRVYALMAVDWTTIEVNEVLSPFGLLVNIVIFVVVLRLKRVE